VDASLGESGVALTSEPLLDYQWNDRVWGPRGNMEPGYAPHNTYPCQGDDVWVAIAVSSEAEWQRLLDVMGHPAWAQDSRFADQLARWKHRDALDELVGQWTATQDRDDMAQRLQAAGVTSAAGIRQPEMLNHEHYQHRQTFVPLPHPKFPEGIVYGLFWKLSDTPGALRTPAPMLGQHNAEILGGLLGLSEEELQRLEEAGVLY
jgi:benzylsuccinate CoA-transferase BbsF subunit